MTLPILTQRIILRLLVSSIMTAWLLILNLTQPAAAQTNGMISLDTTVELTETGDAHIRQDLSMPLQPYQVLRQEIGNPVKLMRRMHDLSSWNQIEEMKGNFAELNNAVQASYCHRGYSRASRAGSWRIDFGQDEVAQLVTTHENVAIFNSVTDTELGPMTIIHRIHTPPGSQNLRYNHTAKRFTYDYQPQLEEGENGDSRLELDCKPQLMSSLAKLYGNDQFDAFWAARSVFTNSGDTTMTDYRIRFRVEGFSSWSSWKKSAVVYPGQTVVDPYYPVLDLEKLAAMTGARPALVHCEYEYKVNGETRKETDAARLQLTSRNEVVYSSRPAHQNLDWYERNDLAEYILAAFTTSQDPIMQQLAGTVSGMAGGVAASNDNQQAIEFLRAFWDYLELNKVAYHTPPGWSINGFFGQHVKYGRDVLRNRAGTCIDLSILWASVAKAVGLKAHIALVWGHAYPVIELPTGDLLPIESTMIGKATFEKAVEVGFQNMENPHRGLWILADINSLEATGVRSLDLPMPADNFLGQLGYHTNRPEPVNQTAGQPVTASQEETVYNPGEIRQRMMDVWLCVYDEDSGPTQVIVLELENDGSYTSVNGILQNEEFVEQGRIEGSWTLQGHTLTVTSQGESFDLGIGFEEDSLVVTEGNTQYLFVRADE